jgi:hypothetical protein
VMLRRRCAKHPARLSVGVQPPVACLLALLCGGAVTALLSTPFLLVWDSLRSLVD